MRCIVSALLVLMLASLPAQADVIVYDNGVQDIAGGGGSARGFLAADDFVLNADTWVTATDWFWQGTFPLRWFVFNDLDSLARPDGVFAEGLLNPDGTFDTPLLVEGGRRYWFSVIEGHPDTDPCTVFQRFGTTQGQKDSLAKAVTHPFGDIPEDDPAVLCDQLKTDPFDFSAAYWGREDYLGITGSENPGDVFFALYGNEVPEPVSALLVLSGVAGVVARRRFRQ